MSDWPPRLVAALVATVGVLCAVALLRSREPAPVAPEPAPGQVGAVGSAERVAASERAPRSQAARGAVGESERAAETERHEPAGRREEPGPQRGAGIIVSGESRPEALPAQDLGDVRPAAERRLSGEAIAPHPVEDGADLALLSGAASASGVAPTFAALRADDGAAVGADQMLVENVDFGVEPGAYFPPDAQLAYSSRGGLQNETGCVMFWVQPVDWDGRDQGSYSFFLVRDPSTLDHHFSILNDQGRLRFQVANEAGVMVTLFHPIAEWERGEWHHVAATWGGGILDLYADGVLVAEDYLEGIPALRPDAPAYWGSSRGTRGAGAILHDTRIFPLALGEADIAAEAQRRPPS